MNYLKDIIYFGFTAYVAIAGIVSTFQDHPGQGILLIGMAYVMLEVKSND